MKLLIVNKCLPILVVLLLFSPLSSKAYSVLTHEAVVDASWQKYIRPLLKQKYPAATDSELRVAHSYAYGGCMIADMGYFPFGSKYFTNLAHYVRTGDFVMALISESQNLNEYAFAMGALSHYMADKYGHSLGTNYAVPLMYKKVGKQYGKVATYEENPIDHSRVEISFDVLQIARGNYATQAYHDFIGFNVAKPVLERAFMKTYGQDINVVFGDLDMAISTFRWAVKSLLPTVTRAAWVSKKDDIKKSNPTATSRSFHYKMKRKDYELEFGKTREKPTFKENVIAFIIKILPKVGPLRALRIKEPDSVSEKLFIASFDTVSHHYMRAIVALQQGEIKLPNVDFDTGKPIVYGEYNLTDETYDEMVGKLQASKFNDLTASLKENILSFYNSADTSSSSKIKPDERKKTYIALQMIKQAPTVKIDSLKTAKGLGYKAQ
jgi:hypothetical protein